MTAPSPPETLVHQAATSLQDPRGRLLAAHMRWWTLPGLEPSSQAPWPVVVIGEGPPLLLLHGFDSSFLEFRRLAPLLAADHTLVIPDLHGFGFTPRPAGATYGPDRVLAHLEALLAVLPNALALPSTTDGSTSPLGVIGASMGGAVALALARRCPERIHRLLLLDPAGLDGQARPLPPLLAALGVRFLSLPRVRRGLTHTAFADPKGRVGPAEHEIASLHLRAPGWAESLAKFASSGGFAGRGAPLPSLPITVLWGERDRVLGPAARRAAEALFGEALVSVPDCGHLPHLDQPKLVSDHWRQVHAPAPRLTPTPQP
jgi:pimeloyl-ACP methyl ester carboxylesterase